MKAGQHIGSGLRWWLLGYVALVAAIVGAMFWTRNSTLSQASPKSLSEWQSWRADVIEHRTNLGPVDRRVPKSEEPPALVLMRDHFAVLFVGALIFSSVLYWIIAWFITGIVRRI